MQATAALRRTAAATASAFALVLVTQSAALAGGGDAQVQVQHDCTSVNVTSSKDISNVVLAFADGDHQKFDSLSGRTGTFRGTGSNAGEVLTTVWVKSGNNKSGDGPGYGERFNLANGNCSEDDGYPQGGGETTPKGEDADTDPKDDTNSAPKGDTSSAPKGGDTNSAPKGGDTASISVRGACESVSVTSSKDISNIVLAFADGDHQKFDSLSGRTGTFRGTGSNAGELIATVWVKSGANHSGDGPGYGERFDLATAGCEDDQPEDDTPENDGPEDDTPEDDTPEDDTPEDDSPKDDSPKDDSPEDDSPEDDSPEDDSPEDDSPEDDTPTTSGPEDDGDVLSTGTERTETSTDDETAAPSMDADVLGATDERTLAAAGDGETRAAGLLPNTGADLLAAALAALAALGIGLVLVRRGQHA